MLRTAVNRGNFDSKIDWLITEGRELKKERRKLSKRIRRLKRCEEFLRGLLRSHTHFPKDRDLRPMYFFSSQGGEAVLIEEFEPPSQENYLPSMKRMSVRNVLMLPISKKRMGFVLFVDPANDFEGGHKIIIADFETVRWKEIEIEEFKEKILAKQNQP